MRPPTSVPVLACTHCGAPHRQPPYARHLLHSVVWTDGQVALVAGDAPGLFDFPFAVCTRCQKPSRVSAMPRVGEVKRHVERRTVGVLWLVDPGPSVHAVIDELSRCGWRGGESKLMDALATMPFRVDSYDPDEAADVAERFERVGGKTRVDLETFGEEDPNRVELRDAPPIDRPSSAALEHAIEIVGPVSVPDLRALRTQLLQTHNHPLRHQPEAQRRPHEVGSAAYRNAQQLYELLDETEDSLLRAELSRYFGDFTAAHATASRRSSSADAGQAERARRIVHLCTVGSRVVARV